jgi:hypothetical protein
VEEKGVPGEESKHAIRNTKRASGGIEICSLGGRAGLLVGMGGGAGHITAEKTGKKKRNEHTMTHSSRARPYAEGEACLAPTTNLRKGHEGRDRSGPYWGMGIGKTCPSIPTPPVARF